MIYLGYAVISFLLIRLGISFINFISFKFLPKTPHVQGNPKVSVLIPARNEEDNIGALLQSLQAFEYKSIEILVYNDHSIDNTAGIVQKAMQKNSNVKLIEGVDLEKGWLGKNFACYNLAKHASGDILLFLDADVEVRNGLIERALTHMQKHKIHLLSIFPQQHLKSAGEKISVPLMNWILLTLLPLFLIRSSKNPAFSAANGQFMMFRTDTYKKTQPHKEFRYHKVEDIATQRYLKKLGYKCDTLVGNEFIQCRMYEGLKDAINGFTKNIFEFFGNSILLTIVISITITIAPIIVFAYFGVFVGMWYVFGMILVRVFVSLTSKQPVFQNILVMIPQHTIFLIIILKGVINYKRKQLLWKGRNVFLD